MLICCSTAVPACIRPHAAGEHDSLSAAEGSRPYHWALQPGWAAENLTQNIGAAFQIASHPEVLNPQAGDVPTQHVFGRNAAGELIHYYWAPELGWNHVTQIYASKY
jgi:hypothetical protein